MTWQLSPITKGSMRRLRHFINVLYSFVKRRWVWSILIQQKVWSVWGHSTLNKGGILRLSHCTSRHCQLMRSAWGENIQTLAVFCSICRRSIDAREDTPRQSRYAGERSQLGNKGDESIPMWPMA